MKLLRCNGPLPRVRPRRDPLEAGPCIPKFVPFRLPPPMPKLHPSLQGSPIWPNSSESALVRYDVKYQMGNAHDAGLCPSPSPGRRVGPVV